MSISKIEEIRKYDRERKRIARSKNKKKEIGTMADPVLNLNETTVSKKNVSSTKPKVDNRMKSKQKEIIGALLKSTVEQEQSIISRDGIHLTPNHDHFVTENKPLTNSQEDFVTENKMKRLAVRKPILTDKYRLASRYFRKLVELKKKKKTLELQNLQNEILEKFRSKREFCSFTSETERVIYRLFDNKKKEKDESCYKKKIKTSEKEEIRRHSISKDNANVFPTARFGKYYYLRCPISQLHTEWVNSHRAISRSTIYRHMDKNCKPMKKTPHLQCYCKECSNLESKGSALIKAGVVGASNVTRHAVEMTWCQYKASQFGYTKKIEMKEEERQFPTMNCVKRKCKKCGIKLLQRRILIVNGKRINFRSIVEWEQWKNVDRKLDSVTIKNTLSALLTDYLLHLEKMSLHYFFDVWMSHQFNCLLDNLLLGIVLFVNDYAQNILLRFQKEPSSVHWIHRQVTLHPSVVFFLCPGCGKVIIKEEIFHITSDLDHGWRGVDYFMCLNLSHLKSKGVKIERIHDFTDNAASQYRSRFVWNHLSRFETPWSRHYFAPNHGKAASDRASGFFKSFIRDNILSQNVILKNIDVLNKFTVKYLEKQPSGKNVCLHETQRKVIYSKEVIRPTHQYQNSVVPAFKDEDGIKRTIHSVRSTGTPGIVQVRSVDCCCHACIRMSGLCKVKHADPWRTVIVEAGADVENMKRSHWDNFSIPPNINPKLRYPVMENTKIKKKKALYNIQDFNAEDEDDVPLSKLRRKENMTDNRPQGIKQEHTFVTDNDTDAKKIPKGETSHHELAKRRNEVEKTKYEDRKTVPDKMKTHKAVSLSSNSGKIPMKSVTEINFSRRLKRKTKEAGICTQKITPWSKEMEKKWEKYHSTISHHKYYRTLELEISRLNVHAIQSTLIVDCYLSGDEVDRIALSFLPEDAPEGLVPIICGSDGNCFCRAISRLIYGNEDHYMEIRVRIVIEAVRKKQLHLNDRFLKLGQSPTLPNRSLSEMYSIYSQCYSHGKTVEEIYEEEVLTICQDEAYMGLWQIHQVANLLRRPVGIVYPMNVRKDIRHDCNRIIRPSEPTEKEPIYILWTPMDVNADDHRVCHFVPLIKW